MNTKTKTVAAVKKTTRRSTSTRSGLATGPRVRLLVKVNPKRPGTAAYERFARYRNNLPVEKYLELGITRLDLTYDQKHEFVQIVG